MKFIKKFLPQRKDRLRPTAVSSKNRRGCRPSGAPSGLGTIHHRAFPMASGEMDKAEFTGFLGQALGNLTAFSGDGSLHYVCMDWRHLDELLAAGRQAYGELKNLCVWVKDNDGVALSQPARARAGL